MRGEIGIAFSMPGGDVSGTAGSRPVDMAHLARQTMDDRALEQEVLALFVQQALSVREKIVDADAKERVLLAHGLKGSARGIGAFAVAECAAAIEKQPEDGRILRKLGGLIDEVRDFIAAISR
ncbi:Hpt domain-containing protein [Mesorhizobium sp. M1A.F.Ca.IN.020.06.1.1]|uniref:Hpt domain-containing protein n=1 Tax=unclassified Mesorhizobium TaxID=325217 RepID=UPI000BAE8783|nr:MULTISPECIES: Hpt domain-containing protein [unclassified Mesorhizobium]PBB31044.1 histidine kinase [Mesorhizobium sp. WSM3882]RUU96688.1 Hpt domain-containing protein [Mesorhizobium sp. M1A.F.Ca.IN.020.03.2.1]RUV87453.1 Hpt domain-containing protein [Mesorhizobium sp. M1A.F.Ca.IN.020.32.1.1]RUW09422.1 Hpt domain-containing protein [Mesorhizobium sp. M1A.F.Ca.IN.022.05.2.1]RUW30240.1 Hpt domain-containing protein [Mesorhizobium sp. M1A.F.Ca.IN.020.06.1.1]